MRGMIIFICLLFLTGCSMGVGSSKITTYTQDPVTKEMVETVTETTPSFWKSENQQMAFEVMEKKIVSNSELAKLKLDQIEKARMERATMDLSSDARAYANALDMVMINGLKTDTNVSDVPIPKNMGETIGNQAIPLAQIAVGGTGALFGVDVPMWLTSGASGGGSTTYMEGVNIGGDAYTNGAVRKDNYDLGGYQAGMTVNRNGGSVTEDNDSYEGNSQSSNGGGDGDTTATSPYDSNTSLF